MRNGSDPRKLLKMSSSYIMIPLTFLFFFLISNQLAEYPIPTALKGPYFTFSTFIIQEFFRTLLFCIMAFYMRTMRLEQDFMSSLIRVYLQYLLKYGFGTPIFKILLRTMSVLPKLEFVRNTVAYFSRGHFKILMNTMQWTKSPL